MTSTTPHSRTVPRRRRTNGMLLVALVPAATGSWLLTCWGAYSAISWLV